MSKNPINRSEIISTNNLSEVVINKSLRGTRFPEETPARNLANFQTSLDQIQAENTARQDPARVAGSLLGNLRRFIGYLFSGSEEKTEDALVKKAKIDQNKSSIDKIADDLVQKKRNLGTVREFFITKTSWNSYYEKPNFSKNNAELRQQLERQEDLITQKGNATTPAEYTKYAELLLNLLLNQKGSGFLFHQSANPEIRIGADFFTERNSQLAEKTKEVFKKLAEFEPTAESEFQLGFYNLDKRKIAHSHFTKALELKRKEFENLNHSERSERREEMKWYAHFVAVFSKPELAIKLLQEEIVINPNHQVMSN